MRSMKESRDLADFTLPVSGIQAQLLPEDHVDHPRTPKQMAPNLALSTLEFIHDMIVSNELRPAQIADAARWHTSTISRQALHTIDI
jgi:hypothetical protein